MFRALMLAFGQLHDRAIVHVLLQSLALTLLIFLGLGGVLVVLVRDLVRTLCKSILTIRTWAGPRVRLSPLSPRFSLRSPPAGSCFARSR